MKRYAALLILGLLALGAAQQYTITRYPQPDGVTCYGDPEPFACVFIPILLTSQTPPPSSTPTLQPPPTESRTPTLQPPLTPTFPTRPPLLSPTPSSTATVVPPLLVNGNFESSWSVGWTRFDLWPELPNFNSESGDPRSRHGGAQSLRIYNEYRCWLAGVYQTVNVRQFSTLKFSTWARTWPSRGFDFNLSPDLSVTDGVAVGIDNSGGTDPTSSGIVWVEASNTENWRQVSVQAVALANRVTVFIRVRLGVAGPNQCQWPLPVLMGFVDDATLEIIP